jgi:hypothetical protein
MEPTHFGCRFLRERVRLEECKLVWDPSHRATGLRSLRMVCRYCGAPGAMRRELRKGFLQARIFPLFGLFPWECQLCRKVRLYSRRVEEERQDQGSKAGRAVGVTKVSST